jgi:outer membrane receptor protein involved in Fe transport
VLSNEYLQNLPNSQFQPDTLNLAPGINLDSAFGGGGSAANAWQLDGVDTSDPEAGSAWSFVNFNIIDEVQLIALGAPAEYGGFTGVVFNSTTKSGGNDIHGLVDAYYSNDSLTFDNNAPAGVNPTVNKYLNTTVNVGGPFIKDKLWWYVSAQYFNTVTNNGGPNRTETSPRLFAKLNWQVNANNNFDAWVEWDKYDIIGRGGDTITPLEATVRERAPEYVWNFAWKSVITPNTVLNVALTGYTGYYYLDPENGYNIPGLYNDVLDSDGVPTGTYSQNSTYYFLADRDRNQLNASISQHVSQWAGDHDFKFGLELERSTLRNRYGYPTGSWEYRNYYGYNYNIDAYDYGTIAYSGGYDVHATNQRGALFAQDDWQITPRFTLNAGVRADFIQGKVPGLGNVYEYTALAPRLGFAWNVSGDGKNLIKAHYGRYFAGAKGSYYYWKDPGAFEPSTTTTTWNGGGVDVVSFTKKYEIDPNLKHPYMDQFTVGYDRDLGYGLVLSATGIYRKWTRFIETVAQNPEYTEVTGEIGAVPANCVGPVGGLTCQHVSTGTTITMVDWDNFDTDTLLVTNPAGLERTYKGILLEVKKNFRNNWQLLSSYVYSKTRGTIDNVDFDGSSDSTGQEFGPGPFLDTSNSKLNWDGKLTHDQTHQVKLQGTYVFPGPNLWLSGNWTYYSGDTYTEKSECLFIDDGDPLTDNCHAFPQGAIAKVRFLAEPRGSRRLPAFAELNARLEWKPPIGKRGNIGAVLEVFNLLNHSQTTEVQDRDNGSFGETLSHNIGRNIRVGVRYGF